MWGPGISAIICFIIFKSHRRLTTLKGTNLTYGFISYFVLSLSFALWTQKLIFLLLAPLGFFNTLGEELGWRGFLQDSLKNMSDINKAIIVGILWELWHFTNRTAGKDFSEALLSVSVFGVGAILISYFMLKLSNRTCSLTIAVTVHAAINSSVEFPMGWQAVLSCVPIWCFLIWKWDEKNISLRSS
jgi:membrane protease YdiL (CAAX protease family)